MSERKWTAGPWHWRGDVNSGEYFLSPGILLTGFPDGTPWGDEIDKANAHLIAAAPELYDALERLTHWKDVVDLYAPELGGLLRTIYEAEAILAKARGEQ